MSSSFMDATCPECGARVSWFGQLQDRPPCPRCGHHPPATDLADTEDKLAEIRQRMQADRAKAEHELDSTPPRIVPEVERREKRHCVPEL